MELGIVDLAENFSNLIYCRHAPRVAEASIPRKTIFALPLALMYSDVLLERFHSPSRAGDLEASTAKGKQGNPTCGDVVEISLRTKDGLIEEARFRALGCAIAIAASDLICEIVEGMPGTSAQVIDLEEISDRLGGVPERRWQCIAAPLAALQDALLR